MKVCMFVKNSFEYDARVTKEAATLVSAGHDVTVVALYVPKVTPLEETTPDGIHVVRVPRSSFGVPAMNQMAQRYAGSIESRHVRLTGEAYNEATVRELGMLSAPSTNSPGSAGASSTATVRPPDVPPGPFKKMWGRITTPILRSFARLARLVFRYAKALLGQQSQWLKHKAIYGRMINIGVSSGADVFHAHDLNTLKIGATCKEKTGSKLVYDSHELHTERNLMTDEWRQDAIAEEGHYLPQADAMIVASPSWIDWNRNLYGTIPDPSVVVLNVPVPTEIDRSKDLRAELDIAPNKRIVIYQGSIQENRGIEPAIEAVTQLDDVVLVVIGYGYYRPTLEDLVAERGLTEKVLFFGPVPNDELISYSASADIGLANIVNSSVSYHTSLPNKLFEYAMAGIPVIGSDSPEIGRVVKEEQIGEVCDSEDADALAAAMRRILSDPGRYTAGLERAAKRYNWSVQQQTLIDLYAGFEAE